MTSTVDTDEMRRRAERVAVVQREHDDAVISESDAELLLFDRVVEAARPALASCAARIPTYHCVDTPGGRSEEWHPTELGVCVGTKVRQLPESRDVVEISRSDLYLTPDVRFLEAVSHGSVSNSRAVWRVELPLRRLYADEVLARYDVAEIARRLSVAIDAQLRGKLQKRATDVRARADKIRAVATLLDAPK